MEKTLKNVAEVSFFYFVIFGLLQIGSAMLLSDDIITRPIWLTFHSVDLPFLLIALIFGTSTLSLVLGDILGNIKTPLIVLVSLSSFAFLLALYLNFFLPDAKFA